MHPALSWDGSPNSRDPVCRSIKMVVILVLSHLAHHKVDDNDGGDSRRR
jgi:hypothetical protein